MCPKVADKKKTPALEVRYKNILCGENVISIVKENSTLQNETKLKAMLKREKRDLSSDFSRTFDTKRY